MQVRRHVRRVAERGVVVALGGAHRAYDRLAQREPDSDGKGRQTFAHELRVERPHRALHLTRGGDGIACGIGQRQRRAEEGHQTIAAEVVDRPLVRVNGSHHALVIAVECGIEPLRRQG